LLKQYPKAVKLVFKNFPLSNHKFARKAAAAAIAAECQGKFWEFHDELFKNYRNLNDKKINDIALKVGLNETQFNADRKNPETLGKIKRDHEEGQEIGVKGIPAMFMNGRRINNRDIKNLPKLVEKELKKTR
jgi:protein-disulfide isomerase